MYEIFINIHIFTKHVYIYIYRERERERERNIYIYICICVFIPNGDDDDEDDDDGQGRSGCCSSHIGMPGTRSKGVSSNSMRAKADRCAARCAASSKTLEDASHRQALQADLLSA
jgi:hypothetical protein